jgi:hypothetical protein
MAQGVPEENIPLIEYEMRCEDIWHFWFLTHNGEILMHGETPFDHEQSPYTVGLYPLVDGNIWGMAWDILDQQKQINRLLTMLDKIMGASAKGALMIPEDAIPEGWTEADFAEEWTKSNGVMKYKPTKSGNKPEQVAANSSNIGAVELLQVQFNLLREISGVNDSIQGQKPNAGTTASQYAQQTNNAALNNKDYFDFFFARRKMRDFKIVKLQQQFYTEDRNIVLSGKDWDDEIATYIASEAKDLDIDMALGNGSNSSAYRQMAEENLWRLLEGQLIDLDIFLQNSSMPFADKLRESMNQRQAELEQAQQQGQQADPRAVQMLEQYAGIGGMGQPQGMPAGMPMQGMN